MRAAAVLRSAARGFVADNCPRLAAALSFYTLVALAPLVLLVVGVAALAYGAPAARASLVAQVGGLVGPQGAAVVDGVLANAAADAGGLATAVSVVLLVVGATGVVGQLQDALNTIWSVRARKGAWLTVLLRKRLLSLGFVAGLGFLLIASLVVSAALAAVASRLPAGATLAVQAVHAALGVAAFASLLAVAYRVLPDCRVRWRDVWPGALATALFLLAGKSALGAWLGNGSLATAYGAASSLAVLLAWVYYTGAVFFFGAEVTEATAQARGQPIVPERGAVPLAPAAPAPRPAAAREPVAALVAAGFATGAWLGLLARLARRPGTRRRGRNPE